ncbi:hypothetical protein Saso_14170 [Streptomyces asoensis]|uniref:Uncharacterized protein n=1 Tax=Streptomyces asoensis TaxID=249586 RepID=A0ABQ3RVB8_9ACTN|nr:hypothetical protein GCM10010496_67220 [Streptomyces asoensis]GHI59767.1 hypothetical protein Saso_14170 [Streptomyces asoensis]
MSMSSSKPAGTDNWRAVTSVCDPGAALRPDPSRRCARGTGGLGTESMLAGVRRAEYDPPNTRTSWKDVRWGS